MNFYNLYLRMQLQCRVRGEAAWVQEWHIFWLILN